MFSKITKKNWLFFAIKNYNVPNLDSETEFYEDIKRFKYIKRLFRKYKTSGELKTRLILNHIIVLNNVFGAEASATLLLYKIEREYAHAVSFLQLWVSQSCTSHNPKNEQGILPAHRIFL